MCVCVCVCYLSPVGEILITLSGMFGTRGKECIKHVYAIIKLISRFIHSMNRQKLSYKLKINHLAEHSRGELRRLRGRRATPWADRVGNHTKEFVPESSSEDIPRQKNWVLYGKYCSFPHPGE